MRIAVPYFPGSNGDYDAINRIEEHGMKPVPLYFHIGDKRRLEGNAAALKDADGVVLPGGFPYEDRLGFGVVPSKIKEFSNAMKDVVKEGKPVIAFCSGNQIANAMDLALLDTNHSASVLPNVADRQGDIVYKGFFDRKVHTRLRANPARNAFTRNLKENEVLETIIDHGGGRFWTSTETLQHLLDHDMILTQYTEKDGKVVDEFPINPNGSMLNIESISNRRGNVKIGMAHNERKLNALKHGRHNDVFASMREYIEDGCPDLSEEATYKEAPIDLKDFSYLSPNIGENSIDIYVEMLTDDNERNTAQLFLEGMPLERRRLIRVGVEGEPSVEYAQQLVKDISSLDVFDGIMLKKDLPYVCANGKISSYEVVDTDNNRDFMERGALVEGMPVPYEQVPMPNPDGYLLKKQFEENSIPGVRDVVTGTAWFFRNEDDKRYGVDNLLG